MLVQLTFFQITIGLLLKDRATTSTAPLYPVEVNLDVESYNTEHGVTMMFEKQTHQMRLDQGLGTADGMAWGTYTDKIETTGWGHLVVSTSPKPGSYSPKMYAAGFVEGLMTAIRISEYHHNTRQLMLKGEKQFQSLARVKQEFQNELGFLMMKSNLNDHIRSEEPDDPYWKQARYILFQLWGMCDGYNAAASHFNVHTLSLVDFIFLNSGGDLTMILEAFNPQAIQDRTDKFNSENFMFLQKNATTLTKEWDEKVRKGHCSAFVRLTEQREDIIMGHATWDDYSKMTRIFKHYDFNLGQDTMAHKIAMSSYPGAVTSMDDFYVLDSGLVVMDTTLALVNEGWWNNVETTPKMHLPTFMHIMITNRLAKGAADWANRLAALNVGTYNSEWMVVDYSVFTPGAPLKDNTLWVVETVPGMVHKEDLTSHLRTEGYWASYDRPYFKDVRDASGHSAAEKRAGSMYSWRDSPRGSIFRKVGTTTESLFDVRGLMRRNMWPNEGVEPSEPSHAIAARMDLAKPPIPNGAIDAKVVNRCLAQTMNVQAVSGPTSETQKPFQWMDADHRELWQSPHAGLPNLWQMPWQQFSPLGTVPLTEVSPDCAVDGGESPIAEEENDNC